MRHRIRREVRSSAVPKLSRGVNRGTAGLRKRFAGVLGDAVAETPPLFACLPPQDAGADAVLEGFLRYVESARAHALPAPRRGDPRADERTHVIVHTPTGSGKSLIATAVHFKALAEGRRSFYTCPIKALVSEKFFALCRELGPSRGRHDDGGRDRESRRARDLLHGRNSRQHRARQRCRRRRGLRRDGRVSLLLGQRARRRLASPAAHVAARPLRADERDARRRERLRGAARSARPAWRSRPCARASARCRSSSTTKRSSCRRRRRRSSRAGAPPSTSSTSRSAARPRRRRTCSSLDYCTKDEKKTIAEALRGESFRSPHGKDIQKLPAARHRPAPRGPLAALPTARREARAARPARRSSAAPTRSASA